MTRARRATSKSRPRPRTSRSPKVDDARKSVTFVLRGLPSAVRDFGKQELMVIINLKTPSGAGVDLPDLELHAYNKGWEWKRGQADTEDWSYPGRQCDHLTCKPQR
jgi:hypothetical protein